MSNRAKTTRPPSTAIERFEQGRPNADDLRVAARLLNRPDLAAAADALSSALAWIEEAEKSSTHGNRSGRPVARSRSTTRSRRHPDRQRAATRPAGPSEARP